MYTISLLIHKEKAQDAKGLLVNEYDFEHIPEAVFSSAEGRAIFEEALAALRRLT